MGPKITICLILLLLISQSASAKQVSKFPDNFQFGTATASYQVEGGWNDDGKGENIWDRYTHTQPYPVANNATGDISCDSYHKYLEDVEMLKHLGVNFYRFSLSWSRILPSGLINHVNQAGVEYYRNLIKALKESNIEPYVTLFHWDLPQPLQDIGGFANPVLEEYFVDYARLAFKLFGDDVKYWMTFNEPKQTCQQGLGSGLKAPGLQSHGVGEYLCAHTVLKSHAKAYHIYDEEFRKTQQGRISFVVDSDWFEPASDSKEDVEAAERKIQFTLGWYANPVYHPKGNYPQVMIDRIAERSQKEGFLKSRLPKFTTEEIDYIRGTYDFLCVNTYSTSMAKYQPDEAIGSPSWEKDTSVEIYHDKDWGDSASDWLKVVPWGTRKLLKWIHNTYNGPEIVITENGFSDRGQMEDDGRINYFTQYLSNILLAMTEDGVNVTGYTAWSVMDNFEWLSGYTEKFGLYKVDFDSPNRTRTIKKSGEFMRKVFRTKCLTDTCE